MYRERRRNGVQYWKRRRPLEVVMLAMLKRQSAP